MGCNSLPPHEAVEEIREEYGLSPERASHVAWLLNDGVLNPSDVRTMLARHAVQSLRDRHGDDANGWPSLSSVVPPPTAQKKKPSRPAQAASHRGEGAIAPARPKDTAPRRCRA